MESLAYVLVEIINGKLPWEVRSGEKSLSNKQTSGRPGRQPSPVEMGAQQTCLEGYGEHRVAVRVPVDGALHRALSVASF